MGAILFLMFLGLLIGGLTYTVVQSIRNESFSGKVGLLFAALSLFPLFLFAGWSPVDAGTVGVVTRMGAVSGTLPPGPHFVTPFIESVHPVSTKTLRVSPDEDASSLDLQQVHTQVTFTYHFDPANITYIYTNLIDSSDNAVENKVITPAILEAIKATTAKYNVQELVEKRAQVRDSIELMVNARIAPYHIIGENVSITDFRFSKTFEDSIEAKQVAQQNAEKAENELKQVKIEAEQKVAAAEGEAKALQAQKQQITPELLQLRMIEMLRDKWDGQLPQNYYGGQAPLPIVEALKGTKK